MSQLSLGIIETLGLAAGIQVADICVKSANVNLIGYEFSKGAGMTVIKIEGNIGAVNAAVDAALASTDRIAYSRVIARPNPEIEKLIRNKDTVGYKIVKEEKIEDHPKEMPEPEPEVPELEMPEPETPEPEIPEPEIPESETPEPKTPEPETPEPEIQDPGTPEPELKEIEVEEKTREIEELKEAEEEKKDSKNNKKKPKKN